ncbi:MAG: hypothetical protein HY282_18795 [Nitrospirae bacterium]|nr:hypothetical protein [Candidatus Manganitrophaceae bacterium]
MARKGVDLIALFYLLTAVACFLPYFQYGDGLLLGSGLVYAIPFLTVGVGLGLRRDWGQKLAVLLSPLSILVVIPLLFREKLTFVYALPWVSVTYPSSSAFEFRGCFGFLIAGHFLSLIYLLRETVKAQFQPKVIVSIKRSTKRSAQRIR